MMSMWAKRASKIFSFTRNLVNAAGRRYILSEAYSCNETWEKRLQSPVFQNVDVNDFVLKLHDKFEKEGSVTAIDMDILANKLQDVSIIQLDFVDKLFYRFRHTQDALQIMPSTPYSLIRAYIDQGESDRLVDIIQDKIGYGMFPDFYSANILMDHLIKMKNYLDAARVACEMALQEDLSNEVTRLLVLNSCHLCLQNPVEIEEEEPEPPAPPSDEVTYMRVPYIRNPHYDDHFDLTDEDVLLGKTLNFVGRLQNDIIGRSSQVIGLAKYQKFDKALALMKQYLETTEESSITENVLDILKTTLDKVETVDPEEANNPGMPKKLTAEMKETFMKELEELSAKLKAANKVSTEDLHKLVTDYVTSELPKYEEKDIHDQKRIMEEWSVNREESLASQVKRYEDTQKKQELIRKMKELRKKEEFLNYYAMKDKILLAESKVPKPKKKKLKEEIDENVLALLKQSEKREKNLV
ncbi:small ribosomal subunit protein mS27-like [Lineus longissimus]|uniref:small ribosomal subunit protein mS27-like n=1 Tax=Lineus longissimus TaxID=88925 RepID=UPI00315D34E5